MHGMSIRKRTQTYVDAIDITRDHKRREHYRGSVTTTKRLGVAKLIYYEAYLDRDAAQEREKKLKQFESSYTGLLKRLHLK